MSGRKAGQEKESAVDVAADWLKSQLENQPPKPAKDLLDAAQAEGISKITLCRAKERLGIEVKKVGYRGSFVWILGNSAAEVGSMVI